jgi:hypothetical protein
MSMDYDIFHVFIRFKSSLFGDSVRLQRLQGALNDDMFASPRMTATGIPPYVTLFMAVEGIPAKLKEILLSVLREQGVVRPAAGEEQGLIRLLLAKLESLELCVSKLGTVSMQEQQQRCEANSYQPTLVNGVWSVLPAGYVLPTRAYDCWTAWFAPHKFGERMVPALKSRLVDKRTIHDARRWSDVRTVAGWMYARLTPDLKTELDKASVTADTAGAVFRSAITLNLFGAAGKVLCNGALSSAVQALQKIDGATKKRSRAQGD